MSVKIAIVRDCEWVTCNSAGNAIACIQDMFRGAEDPKTLLMPPNPTATGAHIVKARSKPDTNWHYQMWIWRHDDLHGWWTLSGQPALTPVDAATAGMVYVRPVEIGP